MFIQLKKAFIIFLFVSFTFGSTGPLYAAERLKVVTSTTFFADLANKIGGDKVEVKYVASPKFNVHFIQPRPSDVKNVSKADLFVFAGLDLEAWVDPLLEAAGKPALFRAGERNVDLSEGIRLLKPPTGTLSRSMGDLHLFGNPHYHMNPENTKIMTETLLRRLKEIDPVNASYYEQNAKDFNVKLDAKIAEWKNLCSDCEGKEVIPYHDDFEYLADFLGIKSDQFLEPKPGIPPTPKHLEFLEDYAKERNVKAVVMPTYFPRETADTLAKRIGVKVVTVCQNVGEVPGIEDIFSLFDTNIRQISEALK